MCWTKHIYSRKCTAIGSTESSIELEAISGEMLWELLPLKHSLVCAWLPEHPFLSMCLFWLQELFESYRAGWERRKGSGEISFCIGSNDLMIFFIGSKLGWLIHTTCLAAVCIWIQGILLKDESCPSTEDSWLGEDVFRSQKPLQAVSSSEHMHCLRTWLYIKAFVVASGHC